MQYSKIIGLGLPKTGTTTLAACLRELKYDVAPYDTDMVVDVSRGNYAKLQPCFERYQAFEDWPWPICYQQFLKTDQKIAWILTQRSSPEIWLKSLQKHTQRNPSPQSKELRQRLYGSVDPWADAEHYIQFYIQHYNSVRETLSAHNQPFLELCWESGDSWPQLCNFLNVDTPVGKALPHANSAPKAPLGIHRIKRYIKRSLKKLK